MSEPDKSTKSESSGQYSNSGYSHKDYGTRNNYRSKNYNDNQRQKYQNSDGYYENKSRDHRKNYNNQNDDQTTQESDYHYRKNYNNGNNSKYDGNYNRQYNNYQKGSKRPQAYQQTYKKKKENFSKVSKEVILEKFTEIGDPSEKFLEFIEANPQLFTKTPQRPFVEEKFELIPDEGVNPKPQLTEQREVKEVREVKEEKHEEFAKEKAVEWDDGGEGDYFSEMDPSKMSALLRGKTDDSAKPTETKNGRKKGRFEEEEKAAFDEELEKFKGKDPWEINEDNGEFSNIDEIFERKLKENQLEFKDDDEVDFGLLKKGEEEDDQEAPVWEGFDAAAIKRETKDVENALMGWKSDTEDLHELNGFIGGGKGLGDSFDRRAQSGQKHDLSHTSEDRFSGFNIKQFEDSGDHDELFRSLQPSATRVTSDKMMQSQFGQQQPLFQQPISLQQQIPIQPQQIPLQQQQIPLQHQQFLQQQIAMQQQLLQQMMAFGPNQFGIMQNKTQGMPLPVGLQSPQTMPNVFSSFVSFGFKPDAWYYLDRQKIRQGPFTTKQMNEWYMGNHLPMDLPITSGENINFMSLRELIDLVFRPSGVNNTVKPQPMNYPTYPQQPILQQQQPIIQQQVSPQQDNKGQFQFSQLLENPMLQQFATQKGTTSPSPMNMNMKTAEELEEPQLGQDSYGQYGNYNRKKSGQNDGNSKKNHQNNQQYGHNNAYNNQGMSPQQYTSSIGMLQPGLAFPQDLGNPNVHQSKRKPSGNMKQQGQPQQQNTNAKTQKNGKQGMNQPQPSNPDDMTNSLKMMLGIGGLGNISLGVGEGDSKKKAPAFDAMDFPSLTDSNK